MKSLEVKTSKLQIVLAILLSLFFVPMGFGFLWRGVSRDFSIVPIVSGVICLLLIGVVVWLVFRGHRKSVKKFTAEGLIRNDGERFLWKDLAAVVDRIKVSPRGRFIWRIEIRFKNSGVAWLLPLKVNNFAEVRNYVKTLPCPHTEERA